MSIRKAFFIARENMTSVYQLEEIVDLAETAYRHFMNHEEEIIYIANHEKGIIGVFSIGDLNRFYEGNGNISINKKYTALYSINYDEAQVFFRHAYPVNEVPVVTEDNQLMGIIRYEKESLFRKAQRNALKAARTGKDIWMKREISRFVHQTKAKVIIYTSHEFPLSQKETEILWQRRFHAGESKWKGLSAEEWKTFWQAEYEDGIVDTMKTEQRQSSIVIKNGVAAFSDMHGKCYSFEGGCRITASTPPGADRRIFMYGSCIIAGAYCKDEQTIASYLQRKLNKEGYTSWKVINKGLFGTEYFYHAMFVEDMSENDVVIIFCSDKWMPNEGMDKLVLQGDLADTFMEIPSLTDHIADTQLHCNYIVNQKLAERFYYDLFSAGILDSERKLSSPKRLQNYYIGWDIWEYFGNYFKQYHLHKEAGDMVSGAIVMNCNPFTKGHRYLIEQALKMVDNLYLFVVEEDRSYFKFQDRFRMVEQGVSDLSGVHVVPSGRYIISLDTFAQYFEKEQVRTVDSMDYDAYIFGEVVATGLGIRYRFVGEEPMDPVTRAYNETLKRILPDFGVEVIEFPRSLIDGQGGVISATLVRKALQEKDMLMIEKLCPQSTATYLKERLESGRVGRNEQISSRRAE